MTMPVRCLPLVVCAVILFSIQAFAQNPDRRQTSSTPQTQEQLPNLPPNASSLEVVASEIGLLRKSVQTLNTRLREISDKLAPDSNQSGSPDSKQNRLSVNLALLTQAEQRAEGLRRQFLELIEKETLIRSRLVQIEEDMRPENIERAQNPFGTTRTAELRDTRRRVLENERRGFENLLHLTVQNRLRLDEDVKQADSLVFKLRQRLFPLIEKEIEKIVPN